MGASNLIVMYRRLPDLFNSEKFALAISVSQLRQEEEAVIDQFRKWIMEDSCR